MADPFDEPTPFVGLTGIEIIEASADRVDGTIVISEIHHQPYGVVHGGVYATLVETLGSTGAAIWAIEQGMQGAVGVSNQTDFLRPTTSGVLLGTATPIHRGRSQQLWEVLIKRDGDGKVAARGQVRLHNVADIGAFG